MKCAVLNSDHQGGERVRVCAAWDKFATPRRADIKIHKGDQPPLLPDKDATKNTLLFEKVSRCAGKNRDASHLMAGRLSLVPKGIRAFSSSKRKIAKANESQRTSVKSLFLQT